MIVALSLLFTAFPLVPARGLNVLVVATALLTGVAWVRGGRSAAPLGLFCTLCLVGVLARIPSSQIWFAVALAGYAAVVRGVPWLTGSAGWVRRGSFGWDVRLLCATSVLLAAIALSVWFLALRPNVDDLLDAFFPDVAVWLLLAGGLLFSMINAAVEEAAYRGVIMQALDAAFGAGVTSLLLQAVAFGTLHIHGFPRGWIGVGLACIYGLMMGLIRRRSAGMLAPWIAHVCTDVTIVGILVLLGGR